jgi:hypothetical protein
MSCAGTLAGTAVRAQLPELLLLPALRARPFALTLFESHEAEDLRIWRIAAHNLDILFDVVDSSELVADLICELHEGTSVTLPGDYSAAQLVLLAYRIPIRKTPRPSNLPGNRYAKRTA